jgi:hypothetical protein
MSVELGVFHPHGVGRKHPQSQRSLLDVSGLAERRPLRGMGLRPHRVRCSHE